MPLSDAEILEQFGREKTRNAAFAHLVDKYQQKIYYPVLLKYDIESDLLVIKTPPKYGAEIQLVLDQKNIDAFWLGDK